MIDIKNLRVVFNAQTPIEKVAIQNLSITIKEKDFVTVIGGNGAGKSTLMNTLAGETRQQQGKILIANRDVSHLKTEKRARYISRVFQDPLTGCFPHLTVSENLALAYGRAHKMNFKFALTKKKQQLFKEKLAALGVGLENRLLDKMGLLSGGQRQAVSLVMATLQPSKVLLLDEHTAALSLTQALQYGNRTLVMQEGQIVKDLSFEMKQQLKPIDLIHYFE